MPQIILDDFNLEANERRLCVEALNVAGNIVGAAKLLGLTRHALKRRIVKLKIDLPRTRGVVLPPVGAPESNNKHPA